MFKPLSLLAEEVADKDKKKDTDKGDAAKKPSVAKYTTKTVVLADGTYGTENVYSNL